MLPAFDWAPVLISTALFTAMHWCVPRWVDTDDSTALKLSRGIAAVLLTLLGSWTLLAARGHWQSAFVYHHRHEDWMRVAFLLVYGHFLADILWMAWSRWSRSAHVRRDLVVHHLLGLVAFTFGLVLQAGYALGLIVMITEVLPVSTGLKGLGIALHKPHLAALADRTHLQLLIWIRLPLWTTLLVLSLRVLMLGNAGDLVSAYQVVTAGLLALISLDLFWVWDCIRRPPRK